MTRDLNDDRAELITFLQDYTLSKTSQDATFNKLLSSQHKRYFAVLTALSELKHQGIKPLPESIASHEVMNKAFLDHIAESVSDLGSALFVWIHGAYKAARQVLRSSIENFLKGVGSIESKDITTIKNTYEVIDIAGNINFFRDSQNIWMFKALKETYANLCADVHTATIQNMAHISALGYFPNFNKQDASNFERLFLKVSQAFACVLCLLFKGEFLRMHFKNRDIISTALTPRVRQKLNA